MKRVYVVTSGEYSDYRIEKIFSDGKKAHMYSLLDPDRRVEEYVVDDIDFKINRDHLRVEYNYRQNWIYEMTLRGESLTPGISDSWNNAFVFTIPLSDNRIYSNLLRYGKNSKVILKVAQDKFAEYCYEHNTSRDEIIRKQDEQKQQLLNNRYPFATTSVDFSFDPWLEASKIVTAVMNDKCANNEPLPDADAMQELYNDTLEGVKKKHGNA